LRALWNDTSACAYGLDAVLGSAAVALLALGEVRDMDGAREAAEQLWQGRTALPEAPE
jgi:anthranilate phosphoribosyltransferase